jgi:hypothetical protein
MIDRIALNSLRPAMGAVAGLALATVAAAASPQQPPPSFGPALIIVAGYELQLVPALFGAIGVYATRQFAPVTAVEMKMDARARLALTVMMMLAMLALVMSGERRPLVIVGIAGGVGYSGVALFELLAAGVVRAARAAKTIVSGGLTAIFKGPKEGE